MTKRTPEHTADYLRERAQRADLSEALDLLDSFIGDAPPRHGDELRPAPEGN